MIRFSDINDYNQIVYLEICCFNKNERINFEGLYYRLLNYPTHSLVFVKNNKVCAYISYVLSNKLELEDIMYSSDVIDCEDGDYIIILGVACLPEFSSHGYATCLMKYLIDNTDKTILLTCHKHLIPFYKKFGFVSKGISKSQFSNEVWYDMVYKKS